MGGNEQYDLYNKINGKGRASSFKGRSSASIPALYVLFKSLTSLAMEARSYQ